VLLGSCGATVTGEAPAVVTLPSKLAVSTAEPTPVPQQQADEPATFAAASLFAQVSPTPETAGVQAAAVPSNRTAVSVQVVPPLAQILPAIRATIPSTGGPSAVALATGLVGLGGLGVWLRHAGRKRRS
jgi:hypothetical protein